MNASAAPADLRHGDLTTLHRIALDARARQYDVVTSLRDLRMAGNGTILVPHTDPSISETGELTEDVSHLPAEVGNLALGDLVNLTGIPTKYLRRCMDEPKARYLAADNVNHWLAEAPADQLVLVRTYGTDALDGVDFLRSIHSNGYGHFDNIDALSAVLEGFAAAGVRAVPVDANLSESGMVVNFSCPDIMIQVPDLVAKYEFGGARGVDNPIMDLGWQLRNSETGGGAFSLAPRARVLVCSNGMVRQKDGLRKVHVGERLAAGRVQWSADTVRKNVELISAQTRDILRDTSTVQYLEGIANVMRGYAAIPVKEPQRIVKAVAAAAGYSDEQAELLLAAFIDGRDFTVLGIGQAHTAIAQGAATGEAQADAEAGVWDILDIAAKAVAV